MRRLLASVAMLAGLLLAPSAVLATGVPTLSQPASPTNAAVGLSWDDVRLQPPPVASVTYHVWRASDDCNLANLGAFAPVGTDLVDITTYSDPTPVDGIYCYLVRADDGSGPADSNHVTVTIDTVPPGIAVTQTGGNGCAVFTVAATATDPSGVTAFTADGAQYTGSILAPTGADYALASVSFVATDGAGNSTTPPLAVTANLLDSTRPPAPNLEVSTDPAQQKATLSWDNLPEDGVPLLQPTPYRVRTKGPQGLITNTVSTGPLVVPNLEPDATYEFTLDATDLCGFGATAVRLVRLNDTTPPSTPILAGPAFDSSSHAVTLSWVPSTDNIQIDHYQILRDGLPLAVTDANVFIDSAPGEHTLRSYVVRAVDTNGNQADSVPATIMTPDWTPPTAPVPTVTAQGTTVTLRWPPAGDNVGVVAYVVLRDDKVKATMTAALRTFKDLSVPPGLHTWRVRAVDDAGLSADSAPQTLTIVKPFARASVVAVKMAGAARGGAARYSLAGPARLLLDVRVIGTLQKAVLRVYVQSGQGRITVWRGTPGSSSPRERLHSALSRHGYVTIKLGRTLHAGRTRLVLIASSRVVIVGSGKHRPSMRAG